jgi:uncharacterized protein (TIGR02996 family)
MARKPPKPPDDPWDVQKIEAKAPDAKSVTAARKVLKKGSIRKVEPRADGQGWWAVCKGLTDTYEVSVKRGPRGGLESRCNCPSSKKPCKHALALLFYLAEHPEARPETAAPAAKATVDFESLLRAAFAAPEDDTARLVLADYLEENDQPDRAALIRVQCELARLAKTDAGWKDLAAREKALLATVRKQIGKIPAGYIGGFVRGFLRLKMSYSMIKNVDGLPARFVQLFRDGWVEELYPDLFRSQMVPLYKLVGTLDFVDNRYLLDTDMRQLAEEVGAHVADSRTRLVRLSEAHRTRYEVWSRVTGGATT